MYRNITIFIFIVLVIIYIYIFYEAIDSEKELKTTDTENKKILTKLATFGSGLILLSGLIYLFIAIKAEKIETEIAFN